MVYEGAEMECREVRKKLIRMSEGDTEAADECRAHLEACQACRAFSHALGIIEGRQSLRTPTPTGLEQRVMNRLNRTPDTGRKLPLRTVQLAAAAVLLVVMSVSLTLLFSAPSRRDMVTVHLYISAPGAERVAVVGDWNGWDGDADPLRDSDGDGVWEIELEVPGDSEYQYQFLIDEARWIADPNSPITVEDGFGGRNSVLDI